MKQKKGFTLIEMLVVIAIIGILAAMLAGPLMNARVSALKVACTSNQSQMGKALFQYESPSYNDVAPVGGLGINSNDRTVLPIYALFQSNLLDNVKIITCPVGNVTVLSGATEGVLQNSSAAKASGTGTIATGSATAAYSSYLFTTYYLKSSPGNRVIAGDASNSSSTNYSPNHGDTANPGTAGANALFKDGHVKASTLTYTVEGAQLKDNSSTNSDKALWGGTQGITTGTTPSGTQIGAYQ